MKFFLRSLPIISSIFRRIDKKNHVNKLKSQKIDEVFTYIYSNNIWNDQHSASGTGSNLDATKHLIENLPLLFADLKISTVLDIPCGDFYWMKMVDLSTVKYIGADIVPDLIKNNKEKFESENVSFQQLNLVEDSLPNNVDLIFCRDCLMHLSIESIYKALENICNSQAEYILTTTYTQRKDNPNITVGMWFPINLQAYPFNFPEPNEIIYDAQKKDKDKILGLWKVKDIKKCLVNQSN